MKMTARNLLGAFLVSLPFLGMLGFGWWMIGTLGMLVILGACAAIVGCIWFGMHLLD